jgi:hypothetical protein
MSEKVLKVCRIERQELHAVEYRMEARVSFAEHELHPVPREYMAHVMANMLREYVMEAVTDKSIEVMLVYGVPTVCPACGREFEDGAR